MLILERPWTRQPPAGTPLQSSFGLLTSAGNAAHRTAYNQASNKFLTRAATAYVEVSNGGIALASPSSLATPWVETIPSYFGNVATLWCLAYCRAPSTTARSAIEFANDSFGTQFRIEFGNGTTDKIGIRWVASGPTTYTQESTISPEAGRIYSIAAVRNGAGWAIYVDNVDCSTSTTTSVSNFRSAINRLTVAGAFATAGASLDGGVLAWAAVLGRAIHPSLFGPSLALFAPRQIIIPTAAAAASSLPTLSASTYVPGSLTSTGWRPQITAS